MKEFYTPINTNYRHAAFVVLTLLLLGSGVNVASAYQFGMNDINITNNPGFDISKISPDGNILLGEYCSTPACTYYHAFMYSNGVLKDIGTLGGNYSYAKSISANNSLVVGVFSLAGDSVHHAFKYTVATSSMVDMGTLGGTNSYADAISADGELIVGGSDITGSTYSHAFMYSVTTSSMVDLGTLGGTNSAANGVSGDGSLIVGVSEISSNSHSFIYSTITSSMTDLGSLGGTSSHTTAISADGTTVVGLASLAGDIITHAYKYSVVDKIMSDLGTLGGTGSNAFAVSADGSIIVGASDTAYSVAHAFKYSVADSTMIDLGTLGGSSSYAYGISADGSIIYGGSKLTGDVTSHAFIYRTLMVDADNTRLAIAKNAQQFSSLLNLKTSVLNNNLDADCAQFGASGYCLSAGGVNYSGNGYSALRTAASIKAAYRVNSKIHAGLVLDQSFAHDNPGNFSAGNGKPMLGFFAVVNYENGSQLHMAAAYDSADLTITRTVLANTEAGKGDSTLSGKGFSAEYSYPKKLGNWSARPYGGLRYTSVKRGGYTEKSGADFLVTYKDVAYKQTTALLGLDATHELKAKFAITLGGGLALDLGSSLDGYKGVMDTLGAFNLSAPDTAKTRLFVNTKAAYKLADNKTLSFNLDFYHQSLAGRTGVNAGAYYTLAL